MRKENTEGKELYDFGVLENGQKYCVPCLNELEQHWLVEHDRVHNESGRLYDVYSCVNCGREFWEDKRRGLSFGERDDFYTLSASYEMFDGYWKEDK